MRDTGDSKEVPCTQAMTECKTVCAPDPMAMELVMRSMLFLMLCLGAGMGLSAPAPVEVPLPWPSRLPFTSPAR